MLINDYDGLLENDIRSMSHENLINAVLRMFRVQEIKCEQYMGAGLLPDELADAFRGKE